MGSSCGASQWPHQAWGQVLPSMDQESGEYQGLVRPCDIDHWWTGATSCRTSDCRHRIKTWKPGNLQPEIHCTSGSLFACRLSTPLKWDMESWHAERDPEVQWISAQQKIADIDCSRRWKPWLRWSLPFPTWNVLNARCQFYGCHRQRAQCIGQGLEGRRMFFEGGECRQDWHRYRSDCTLDGPRTVSGFGKKHPFIAPLCKRKLSKWPRRMWRTMMCGQRWNNWKWNMGTKTATSSLKILWQPPVRVMLSQENRVFALECVIQSETMFPDYSHLLGSDFMLLKPWASKGARCVITVRNPEKGQAVKADPEAQLSEMGVTAKPIVVMKMDNCDFESIRTFTDEFKKQYDRLDIVCNNAGVMGLDVQMTKDGYDIQIQTNHWSHFLMTARLWPLLKATAVWRCNSHPSVLWCFWKGWTHRRCCKSQQSSSSSWTDAILSPVCSWWFYRTLGSLWLVMVTASWPTSGYQKVVALVALIFGSYSP